jgi:hypothetical protein
METIEKIEIRKEWTGSIGADRNYYCYFCSRLIPQESLMVSSPFRDSSGFIRGYYKAHPKCAKKHARRGKQGEGHG